MKLTRQDGFEDDEETCVEGLFRKVVTESDRMRCREVSTAFQTSTLLNNFVQRVGLVKGVAFDPAMLGSPAERCSNSHENGLTRRLRCSGQHR